MPGEASISFSIEIATNYFEGPEYNKRTYLLVILPLRVTLSSQAFSLGRKVPLQEKHLHLRKMALTQQAARRNAPAELL